MKAQVCCSAIGMQKTIELAHFRTLPTEGHMHIAHTLDLARKCSIKSATLLAGGRAWVYMEHELGGDR
jgi:hypothetical protein